ncbi:hypothetical protein [Streptomyces sp. NPDC002851]
MRIYRTAPVRDFSIFGNALLRDRRISWCAAGVLMYLLSLPNGARACVRSLAEQRKEGRHRIAGALRELEEARYLRRDVYKERETGRLFTRYEVFDTPYDDEPREGEPDGEPDDEPGAPDVPEDGRNLASGEQPTGPSGSLPLGESTGEQEPPPGRAAALLQSLGRRDRRLRLGVAEVVRLAPLVEEWFAAGVGPGAVRAALTEGLPTPVYSPAGLLKNRLERKRPVPAPTPAPTPVPAPMPDALRPPPPRTAEEGTFVAAALRGAAAVREALAARCPAH